ncbi:DUF1848 domain-containing protein [Dethiothermospora halolimnae]|uniref:DUF1848 domain-containing protein n=1 Tax=Dethiothermospora halolimnae TaxID=3114390 RepID=UPI003CCBFEC4
MILSVSRRTDILAFYCDWFFNRLKEGYVLVRNPMNYRQVSKIKLTPEVIDCIVFWTKDPTNIIKNLDKLNKYNYYFQVTINPYDKKIEKNVPMKKNIIKSFKFLSEKIGREKVIWRYDPILLTKDIDIAYHEKYFEVLASRLYGYTDKCVISFIDLYTKIKRNMKYINQEDINYEKMLFIGEKLSKIASKYNITIESCSEKINLSRVGINHGKCIDGELISRIVNQKLEIKKDKNQRELCGCIASIDIGTYNTCDYGCLYCYANFSDKSIKNNILKHDINSPMLIGNLESKDKITDRKIKTYIDNQISFSNMI